MHVCLIDQNSTVYPSIHKYVVKSGSFVTALQSSRDFFLEYNALGMQVLMSTWLIGNKDSNIMALQVWPLTINPQYKEFTFIPVVCECWQLVQSKSYD